MEAYPDRTFIGEVMKIEPMAVVQNQVTTFPVLSRVANAEGLLLPGMNADVEVVIHRRNQVIAIPNESVKTMDDAGTVAGLLSIPFDEDQLRFGSTNMAANDHAPGAGGVLAGAAYADEARPDARGHGDGADAAGTDAASGKTSEKAGGDTDDTEDTEETEDFDFSKMQSMGRDERRKYMEGLSDKQRTQMRAQMASRFGNRDGGSGGGGARWRSRRRPRRWWWRWRWRWPTRRRWLRRRWFW